MKHTQEPWEVWNHDGEWTIEARSPDSGFIVDIANASFSEPDARRIVACVNACRSVSDEDLADDCVEKMKADRDALLTDKQKLYGWVDDANFKKNEYFARAEKAESQRDELLAALKERTGFYYERNVQHQFDIPHCLCRECTDKRCDLALSKIEAKK